MDGHTSFLVFLVSEITNQGIMGRRQAPAFLVPPQTLWWHFKPYVGTIDTTSSLVWVLARVSIVVMKQVTMQRPFEGNPAAIPTGK